MQPRSRFEYLAHGERKKILLFHGPIKNRKLFDDIKAGEYQKKVMTDL